MRGVRRAEEGKESEKKRNIPYFVFLASLSAQMLYF